MPFVHVQLTAGVTPAQKDEVIKGMTDVLVDVLHKDPAKTWVVIEEISNEDWGVNGTSIATGKKTKA